jgi:hypothetical protein
MKKFLIAIALATLLVEPVMAGGYGDGPGCGLPAELFKDGPKDIMHQSMAWTTNSFLPQSFAVTSQTWNCTNNGKFWAQQPTAFAKLNFDNLSQDMAQGGGEYLASFATLMGVPAEQEPAFFALTQDKYVVLTQIGKESPAAMVEALDRAMASHPTLVKISMAR